MKEYLEIEDVRALEVLDSRGNPTVEVEVIVEKGVCKDLSGFDNIRREKEIIIDRRAPKLVSVEIICSEKEAYKEGDKFKIIGVFDENISNTENIPEIKLAFSKTGEGKGILSEGRKNGKSGLKILQPLILNNEDGSETDELKEIYNRKTK